VTELEKEHRVGNKYGPGTFVVRENKELVDKVVGMKRRAERAQQLNAGFTRAAA
jgi:hypothetical protein